MSLNINSPFESSLFVSQFNTEALDYLTFSYVSIVNNNNLIIVYILFTLTTFISFFYSSNIQNSFFFNQVLVPIYAFCYGLALTYVPKHISYIFPYILYIFNLLLFANLIGMIPFNFAITSHLSFTFLLAFTVWFSSITLSFYYSGLAFLTHFLIKGIPNPLVPMLLVIELLSFFIRVISLSLRLFANIFSGHMLLHVISSALYELLFSFSIGFMLFDTIIGIIGTAFFSILVLFEVLVGLLQAYIFALLSLIYLSDL